MSLESIFINNLRIIRKKKNITQEKLADLCETNTSYIGQIETGKRFPSMRLIEKICIALDTPAYKFFMSDTDRNDLVDYSKIEQIDFLISEIKENYHK